MISTTINAEQAAHVKAIRSDFHEAVAFTAPGSNAALAYLIVPAGTAEKIAGIIEAAKQEQTTGKLAVLTRKGAAA